MAFLTIDLETYFDDAYTLKKMTTEEYVRDSRFKTHCIGVKNGRSAGVALWGSDFANGHRLKPLIGHSFLCHHAQFDGLALNHHYGIAPLFWFDTLSMARMVLPQAKSHSLASLAQHYGLQGKTVPYDAFRGVRDLPPELQAQLNAGCVDDLDITFAVFQKLLVGFPREELKVIDLTIRMFTEPALCLDRLRLAAHLTTLQTGKEALLTRLGVEKADLHSAERFADLLRLEGVEPPCKISPRTGKEAYAFAKTDDAMKQLAEHPNSTIQGLVAARLGTKSTLDETRCQRLLDMDSRGRLAVYLNFAKAHTFRWTGGDSMNWQNFPRGGEIRKSITAPDGYVVVVGDLNQIECRCLNWLAGQLWVLEAFKEKRDLYSEIASDFFGRTITKDDKNERMFGKVLILASGFGMGAIKFQKTAGNFGVVLTEGEADAAIKLYRQKHPRVTQYWKQAEGVLQRMYSDQDTEFYWGIFLVRGQKIILPNGAALDYSNLSYDGKDFYTTGHAGKAKIYGGKLVENVVQALARVMLSQAMLRISPVYKIVMSTHDEVAILAPEAGADEALDFVLSELRRRPVWADDNLPLDAEGGFARNYSK